MYVVILGESATAACALLSKRDSGFSEQMDEADIKAETLKGGTVACLDCLFNLTSK